MKTHVTHHYDFYDDKLIIGKFCQIAAGIKIIMNGANHQMNAASTFPFYIFEGWEQNSPLMKDLSPRGNTVIGNDVWIGENVTILPGVTIGDGAIIGTESIVGSDVGPYTIVAGNPAKTIRKRFDNELTELLLAIKWWNLPIPTINELIPALSNSNIEESKTQLRKLLDNK